MNVISVNGVRTPPVLLDVDLRQVVFALSDALDLVGLSDVAHGKRVAVMAEACARALGLPSEQCDFIFDLGLLHDIGVSSSRVHAHLVDEFDWESSQEHCVLGSDLLRRFAPLASMADPVLYHHTHWAVLAARSDLDPDLVETANLIFLADRVDALSAAFHADGSILMHSSAIRRQMGGLAGGYFSPRLLAAFDRVATSEAFWLGLEPRGIQHVLQEKLGKGRPWWASMRELKQLAYLFARIVDAKSPYTADHSLGVARVARLIGRWMGLDRDHCDKLLISALLHDLGKLRVPDEILEKPGPLDDHELSVMQTHSYETYQILGRIRGLEEIAQWAAYHHEAPGGKGYPFHIDAAQLSLPARILRVADIFQAMVQNRPYRSGMSGVSVRAHLHKLVLRGLVDECVVEAIDANMTAALRAAGPVRRRTSDRNAE